MINKFLYRLFGLGLAVMSARMQCGDESAAGGQARLLFPDLPRPGRGHSYPWGDLCGLLPRPPRQPALCLAPGLPRGWKRD